MERQGDGATGFSVVEAVIVVAVVGIIGATGWFVYLHNRTKVTNAASGTPTTTQTTTPQTSATPTSAQNIVKIPELGIQITAPDSIKDLTYQTSTVTLRNGNPATVAMFSTAALTALDAKCGPSAMPLGSLEKSAGQYPSSNVLDYGQLVKQFPTFYIAAGYPQAGCSLATSAGSDSAAANNNKLANTDKAAFESAFSTIQALN